MSIYLENPMDSNENLIETVMEFRKTARYIMTSIKTKTFITRQISRKEVHLSLLNGNKDCAHKPGNIKYLGIK